MNQRLGLMDFAPDYRLAAGVVRQLVDDCEVEGRRRAVLRLIDESGATAFGPAFSSSNSTTRRDGTPVRELLHPGFAEVGGSGRRWTRDEIVDALSNEDERPLTLTDEWEFLQLSSNITPAACVIRSAAQRGTAVTARSGRF